MTMRIDRGSPFLLTRVFSELESMGTAGWVGLVRAGLGRVRRGRLSAAK